MRRDRLVTVEPLKSPQPQRWLVERWCSVCGVVLTFTASLAVNPLIKHRMRRCPVCRCKDTLREVEVSPVELAPDDPGPITWSG